MYAWGYNGNGQLGDGSFATRTAPVQAVMPAGVTFTHVDAGTMAFALALAADGRVYACGYNDYGQLGDGTTTQSLLPVQLGGTATGVVTSVTFGGVAATALVDNGDGTISVTTPPHAPGPVDVVIEWLWIDIIQAPVTYAGGYTYAAPAVAPTVSDPASQSVSAGESVSFSVTATGTPAPSLAWEVSTDSGGTWQPISADTAATVAADGLSITIASAPAGHYRYRYRAIASNSAGTATSAAAALAVVSATGGPGGSSNAGNDTQLATTGGMSPFPFVGFGAVALLAGAAILDHRLMTRRTTPLTEGNLIEHF